MVIYEISYRGSISVSYQFRRNTKKSSNNQVYLKFSNLGLKAIPRCSIYTPTTLNIRKKFSQNAIEITATW